MIKKRKKPQEQKKSYRINRQIFAKELRVLDPEGKQIGVLSKDEALAKAEELELDLVEIAPKAQPPVAKIVNYNKFLYQEEKKKREEKRKSHVSETKEVRLGPFMNEHDLGIMTKRAREFLRDRDKVRLVVKFIGRQITHPEFGQEVINKVVADLTNISKLEREPHFEGKQLIALLSPERKKASEGSEEQTENA